MERGWKDLQMMRVSAVDGKMDMEIVARDAHWL